MYLLCLFLALLVPVDCTTVHYLEGNDLSHALSDNSLTYVSFPEACETNCRADFVFQAKSETKIYVLQDAFYEQRLLMTVDGAAMQTTDEMDLDTDALALFRRTETITVSSGKLVTVSFVATSLEGRFAVLVGERSYGFWQLTIGFPVLVQSLRMWSHSFYFPIIFGILCLLFFLSWPLQKKRPNTTMILSSLAMLSLMAWAIESFYAYFSIASLTKKRSFFSFLLHVVVNLFLVGVLSFTMHESLATRRTAVIFVATLSLLVGGAGGYLCPALLLLELLFLREAKGKTNSIVCKAV